MRVLEKFGDVSFLEKVQIWVVLLRLPVILAWKLLISPFSEYTRHKTWRQVLGAAAYRACVLSIPQMQYIHGQRQTIECYKQWSAKRGLPVNIENAGGEDAKMLWVGEKRTDRVIYYLHGGGYALPLADYGLSFWRYVQEQLGKRGLETGVVVLKYALIPDAPFPTVLRQAVRGLQHLIDSGVHPDNIQLVGDSAGGNLILQLLSHLLHPLPDVPTLTRDNIKLKGACLVSPWVSFRDEDHTHILHDSTDIIRVRSILEFGEYALRDVQESQMHYIELIQAPESWWSGLDSKVDRVLLTAGGAECFKEDIVKMEKSIGRHHGGVTLLIQEHGVHVEPYVDFLVGERKLVAITSDIVDWISAGFLAAN
ncbi:hypothetical protein V5O48_006394 [Marasmius crinis-equi]|uniref:Alpha/beta hydrolase fold-3 domain-containing protein n=1 Tax=Marasmius crinis-equi TaxID=585013 RepID=A0ABR3FJL1_9AGAR